MNWQDVHSKFILVHLKMNLWECYSSMHSKYHHQQNKCYPQKVFTCPFRSYSILAIANLLAHNNKSQICYCGQISLQSAAVNCSLSENLTPLQVTFILLAVEQENISLIFQSFTKCMIFTITNNATDNNSDQHKL